MFCVICVTVFSRSVNELCELLKTNTTVTELELNSEHKQNNTQMVSINNPLFFNLIISTVNNIGERGVKSLSDALKSNTSITKLNLRREYKRNNA